jgi:hypothetical protein
LLERDEILNNIKNITDLQKKKEQINKWIKWGFGGTGAVGSIF